MAADTPHVYRLTRYQPEMCCCGYKAERLGSHATAALAHASARAVMVRSLTDTFGLVAGFDPEHFFLL